MPASGRMWTASASPTSTARRLYSSTASAMRARTPMMPYQRRSPRRTREVSRAGDGRRPEEGNSPVAFSGASYADRPDDGRGGARQRAGPGRGGYIVNAANTGMRGGGG